MKYFVYIMFQGKYVWNEIPFNLYDEFKWGSSRKNEVRLFSDVLCFLKVKIK